MKGTDLRSAQILKVKKKKIIEKLQVMFGDEIHSLHQNHLKWVSRKQQQNT